MLRITVDGLTILGRPMDSSSRVEGLFVGRNGFDGWDDGGGDVRREAIPRPAMHGEFDLPAWQGSRVVSIDGHAIAWSELKLGNFRNQVMGIAGDGQQVKMTIDHQGSTLWAYARRGAKPTFKDSGVRSGRHHGRFLIQLVCADPRKYGPVQDYAAGESAVNYGNFPARPTLIVTGTEPGGYTVTGPDGRRIVVTRALSAGAPHEIDFARGGLYIGGARQSRSISIYQPWTVGPGLPGAVASVSSGLSLVQRVTDTYI